MFSTRGASDSNIHLQPTLTIPPQETLEQCSKETEFRCILFALCYFHAAVAERRRFGTQGWNRPYPFNNGDLTVSVNVLHNYLEANPKVRDNKVTAPQHSTHCSNWPFLEHSPVCSTNTVS